MKRIVAFLLCLLLLTATTGCSKTEYEKQITATTLPVYEFASRLCDGTDIHVERLITENVSCLHDYTLQVSQMKMVASSDAVIINGCGLEDFLDDVLPACKTLIDASRNINTEHHAADHDAHHHDQDPHIWLSPKNAKSMAENIYQGLIRIYPTYKDIFNSNLTGLLADLDKLDAYARNKLESLDSRKLITFHDGFGYFAQAFDLTILKAIEEESGSEASAAELIEICNLVQQHQLSAVFIEKNGSSSAAEIIARETGVPIYSLDMAMAGNSYFDAMYHNIDTIKEALG